MTRINTNVSSLNAQKSLARANVSLQDALTRLSTGLRINVGKDDPAGLIASEVLRSDITSVQRAITNSERANQMIATADSALGAVSGLLNDVRGLITESANTGALSSEQIAANQLQIDSSLTAINRISQTTSFQGRKLLDGSLAFTYTETAGFANNNVEDLQINQATIGSTGAEAIAVDITSAAEVAEIRGTVSAGAAATKGSYTWNIDGDPTSIKFEMAAGASGNGVEIQVYESASVVATSAVAFYDANAGAAGNGTLDIYVSNIADTVTTTATIANAVDAAAGGGTFTMTQTAGSGYKSGTDATPAVNAMTSGGADATNGLDDTLVLEIAGNKGSEVLQFGAGTTGATMKAAINMVSASTGVAAEFGVAAATTLQLTSTDYGADAFVDVNVVEEGAGGTFGASLTDKLAAAATRDAGADIAATVNGITAIGKGNAFSVNSSTLSMEATVKAASTTDFSFSITGGGALFQLGPDVNTSNQARLGIQSVNAATLQGASGRLYTLGSGQSNALETDVITAAKIADEVIVKVTSLRGRLGAFQKTTLETNINTLTDTLENLTGAESSIRDADFAAESAALTRSQILVQSGTSVLGIANQNPQNVLALLR